ncbi:MAG: riboflavin synthase [Planctomycetes bacterium]|nr:riboflavin synthase [Planctomycetota bacterium]
MSCIRIAALRYNRRVFTGIVLAKGRVALSAAQAGGKRLEIEVGELAREVKKGDSVAISGVCLTAVEISATRVAFDVVAETLSRTTLRDVRPGDEVNLELALRANDRMGGHFVQGHVDGVGTIRTAGPRGGDFVVSVRTDPALAPQLVEKGSVAVDGVSLTIVEAGRDGFAVALIPHTREATTLGRLRPGSRVNVEVDILAKYVARLLEQVSR